jgi:two-component system, LytTR family, sensor kinase
LVWYKNEKIRKELENQKLQAELSFLKMQINPHFLFNALNNIYSMAVLEKTKRTGDNIMKLSELIRYMLYEKEDEQYRVSLDKEINHINSFIDLQKLRHEGDIYIRFSIEGYTPDKKIPPLLLFPLIENSFKHGVLQDCDKPVVIQLTITDHHLVFSIHNYKNNYLKDLTGGIGLVNVRKRLALLYPEKHNFTLHETAHDFSVELQLPL